MSAYVVRRLTPKVVLPPVLGICFLVAWTAALDPPRPMIAILVVAVIASAALRARALGTRLRVASRGIVLSAAQPREPAVHIPWASVREVVVVTDPTSEPRVGVRLHLAAPLPTGVRGLVHDPAQPDRVQPLLVREVPGLDCDALRAAVEPHGVPVVVAGSV